MEIDNTLCDGRYYLSMDNVNKLIATLPYIKIQKSVKQLMSPNHHDKYAYDLIEFQTRDFSINAYNFLDDCGWFCSSLYHYTDLMMIVEYCPNYISKQGNSYSMKYYISDEDVAKLRKIYHITCNDKNSIVYDDYPDNVRLTKDGDGWYSESHNAYAMKFGVMAAQIAEKDAEIERLHQKIESLETVCEAYKDDMITKLSEEVVTRDVWLRLEKKIDKLNDDKLHQRRALEVLWEHSQELVKGLFDAIPGVRNYILADDDVGYLTKLFENGSVDDFIEAVNKAVLVEAESIRQECDMALEVNMAQVNDDKVFCKDCKWIDGWTQFAPSTRKCLHEHSEIKTYHSVSGELIKDYDLCVIRNSCMHCPDFEPKEMNDEWEHCNWCEYNMLYLTRNMLYCMHPSCEFDEDGNSLTRCRDKNPDGKCKNRKERNTPCNPNLKENDNK